MNNNGSFTPILSTIESVTNNGNCYLVLDGGNYSLYTADGEHAYIFESGSTVSYTTSVNLDVAGVRYIAVRYNISTETKYIFVKLTKAR